MFKDLLKRLVKAVFDDGVHQLEEPRPIFVVHKAIVEDSEDFMNKQSYHSVLVLQRLLLHQQAALDDTREVAQIKSVVRLGRRWKQVLHSLLVHLE